MIAVVTGGATGIGRTIVTRLATDGANVIAVDWDADACRLAEQSFGELGKRITMLGLDVGTPDGARAAIGAAVERFGRIDLLCNNAAVHPIGTIEEHDLSTWREAFRVNVDGTMLCSQAALPHMKSQSRGTIINMGSVSASVPYATGGAYAATKAAVVVLTKVLALEAGPFGIRVNCISAGSIVHRVPAGSRLPPSFIPVGRYGSPDDVASLVRYLASDEASYINGAEIVIDGGATAGREKRSSRAAT
jgi:NAD(P)-dependent dehydrogenase (short-subunit alcohol dehydrogenase family)